MKTEDLVDLVPLAALGALDGRDLADFETGLRGSVVLRAELRAFEDIASRIGLSVEPRLPSPPLRRQVLSSSSGDSARGLAPGGRKPRARLAPILSLAAVVVLGLCCAAALLERSELRRQNASARAEVEVLKKSLAEERALREALLAPASRVTRLTAPGGRATAWVVWSPMSREAVLLVRGLDAPATGKTYEAWVIAEGAPAPAGLFQISPGGSALLRLDVVADTAKARTFAVTLEDGAGSSAPTTPPVLSGTAG